MLLSFRSHPLAGFRATAKSAKPFRRSASKIRRSARPPGWTAACITFSRPSAKPNSALVRHFNHHEFQFRARARRRTVCACHRRHHPALRSAARAASGCPDARSTLSKPSTRSPERRASPRSPSMRVDQRLFGTRRPDRRAALTGALAARANSFFSTALSTASCGRVHPHAAARQLGRDIGNDLAIGIGDKTDESVSGMIFARDDVAAFAHAGASSRPLPFCAPLSVIRLRLSPRLLAFFDRFFDRLFSIQPP